MLLADAGDLNPKMALRWQAYLERTARGPDPVFAPWHALAKLPEGDFEAKAARLVEGLKDADPPINPLVARALADRPPRTLAEAAADVLAPAQRDRGALAGARPPRRAERDRARPVARPGPRGAPAGLPRPRQPAERAAEPDRRPRAAPRPGVAGRARQAARGRGEVAGQRPGAPPRAMVLEDIPKPVEPRVFLRGNPQNLGPAVPRQFLAVLAGPDRRPFRDGSGRLELARAIVDPDNPLTARVMVNRIWMHHFGAPLVSTPSDFGVRSDPPTHPELLDHLATRFVAGGWSIKAMHRAILLSRVYSQASDDRPECRQVDPENTLLWRMNRRRLDFEATRDALLAASGRLDRTVGGPSMPDLTAPSSTRRTLYASIDRLNLPGLFRTFDFPDPNATSPRRDNTTIAPQALFLMNHPFVLESARALERSPRGRLGDRPHAPGRSPVPAPLRTRADRRGGRACRQLPRRRASGRPPRAVRPRADDGERIPLRGLSPDAERRVPRTPGRFRSTRRTRSVTRGADHAAPIPRILTMRRLLPTAALAFVTLWLRRRSPAARAADPLRIIVFGAHPDDCELEAGGTAARWAKLGHKVKFVSVTNGDIGHFEHGRRDPRPPPGRRGQAVRRDPRHRDRGARHPRRRADADAGEPPDDHPPDPRVEGRHRHRPPAQRLPPRPPLHRHPRAGRRVHGHRPQLLPRRPRARQEPGLPLRAGRLPEAQPVRARRRGADRPGARPEGGLRRRPGVAVLRVEPPALRLPRPGPQGEGRAAGVDPQARPRSLRQGRRRRTASN